METIEFRDLRLSRLMLGTVQFGLNYGIANQKGQPTYEEVRAILECAAEHGVNGLDTAAFYGSSEEVLGKAIAELGLQDHFVVVTKVGPLSEEKLAGRPVAEVVEESVRNSLRLLRLEALPLCLMHREEDAGYFETLLALRDKGLIRHVGCSTASPGRSAEILDFDGVEAIQIPSSILDQRFLNANVPQLAQVKGAALFVRSVFLQGLLLMPEDSIPPGLHEVIPVRHQLAALAAEAGLTLEELGARYALGFPGLTSLVVGVDSAEQLRRNAELFSAPPLDPALLPRIHAITAALRTEILNPALWSSVRDPWGRRQNPPQR